MGEVVEADAVWLELHHDTPLDDALVIKTQNALTLADAATPLDSRIVARVARGS